MGRTWENSGNLRTTYLQLLKAEATGVQRRRSLCQILLFLILFNQDLLFQFLLGLCHHQTLHKCELAYNMKMVAPTLHIKLIFFFTYKMKLSRLTIQTLDTQIDMHVSGIHYRITSQNMTSAALLWPSTCITSSFSRKVRHNLSYLEHQLP